MEAFYPEIRAIHIAAALTSGGLLLLRALAANLLDAAWARALPLRLLAWTIDTVLLTAAFMLMSVTGAAPIKDAWLTVKLLLVVAYIVFGYFALRSPKPHARWVWLAAAVVTFGFIYSIAREHNPLGIFA